MPEITIPNQVAVTHEERTEPIVGTGSQITSLNQVVGFEVTLLNSADGSTLTQSTYSGQPVQAPVGSAVSAIGSFGPAMLCAREGSRIVAAFPAKDIDPSVAQSTGIAGNAGIIAVVDIVSVMKKAADGAAQPTTEFGMPAVVTTPEGQPGVVVPDSAAPTEVRTQTVLRGSGEKLTAESAAVVNVVGVTWARDEVSGKRTVFQNSWEDATPQAVNMSEPSALPAAVSDALLGATVGSQILVVIPASANTGELASANAPADKDLIYVVDVLGTL